MTNTPDLIDMLVERAAPVRRLRPPLARAALWLLFATLILGVIAVAHGLRPDIAARLRQPVFFVWAWCAALATGILAAIASFRVSLPDGSRWWVLLPVPALVLSGSRPSAMAA